MQFTSNDNIETNRSTFQLNIIIITDLFVKSNNKFAVVMQITSVASIIYNHNVITLSGHRIVHLNQQTFTTDTIAMATLFLITKYR